MEEEKRYTWLDMYRRKEPEMSYEQMRVRESFDSFFEGVMRLDAGRDIREYYGISLHLIVFLTIQADLRKKGAQAEGLSKEESVLVNVHPIDVFGESTKGMPRLFMFNRIPQLTVPKEYLADIRELVMEIMGEWGFVEKAGLLRKAPESPQISSPDTEAAPPEEERRVELRETYIRFLLRALRNSGRLSERDFQEDGYSIASAWGLGRLIAERFRDNGVVMRYHKRYDAIYFMNFYYRARSELSKEAIPEKVLLAARKAAGAPQAPPSADGREEDLSLLDERFAALCYSSMGEFCRRMQVPEEESPLLFTIFDSFLLMEDSLHYFADFSAEVLIVSFSFIFLRLYRRQVPFRSIYEAYAAMDFVSPYRMEGCGVGMFLDEFARLSVVETYRLISPEIVRNMKLRRTEKGRMPHEEVFATPKQDGPRPETKRYVLSPLSGGLSKIIPVAGKSRKVLFDEGEK